MPKLATDLEPDERDYILLFANDFMHKAPNEYRRGGSISRDMFMPILMKQMIKLHPEEWDGWHDNILKEDHQWLKQAVSVVDKAFERSIHLGPWEDIV